MLGEIERRLTLAQADPSRLVIEVTETASISDMERARAFCAGVQALGCAVALDDFGAGFGSFQYLKHLPFRYLKIDGDFIRGLPDSRNDQLVVKALVGVVAGMGAETIAEFVGDEATMRAAAEATASTTPRAFMSACPARSRRTRSAGERSPALAGGRETACASRRPRPGPGAGRGSRS